MKLTDQQEKILRFIEAHVDDNGFPPTRAEICQAFEFKSPNAAENHLRALERKGVIALSPGKARGITIFGYP